MLIKNFADSYNLNRIQVLGYFLPNILIHAYTLSVIRPDHATLDWHYLIVRNLWLSDVNLRSFSLIKVLRLRSLLLIRYWDNLSFCNNQTILLNPRSFIINRVISLVASFIFLLDNVVIDHALDQNFCNVSLGLIYNLISLDQEIVNLNWRLRWVALLN